MENVTLTDDTFWDGASWPPSQGQILCADGGFHAKVIYVGKHPLHEHHTVMLGIKMPGGGLVQILAEPQDVSTSPLLSQHTFTRDEVVNLLKLG